MHFLPSPWLQNSKPGRYTTRAGLLLRCWLSQKSDCATRPYWIVVTKTRRFTSNQVLLSKAYKWCALGTLEHSGNPIYRRSEGFVCFGNRAMSSMRDHFLICLVLQIFCYGVKALFYIRMRTMRLLACGPKLAAAFR